MILDYRGAFAYDDAMSLFHSAVSSADRFLTDTIDALGSADPLLLALGVVLGLLYKLPKAEAWANIVRASVDGPVPSILVWKAYYLAGGTTLLLPTKGGDLVRAALVSKRIRARYSTMVATFAPEGAFEMCCGFALIAWAASSGHLPAPDPSGLVSPVGLPIAGIAIIGIVALARRSSRMRRVLTDAVRGCAILAQPRRYLREVVSLHLLARLIRLGSIMAFLAAFDLPHGLVVALVVMATQGASSIVPVGAGAAAVQYGLMVGAFASMGLPAEHAATVGYLTATSVLTTIAMVAVAVPIAMTELGGCSRAAFARLRANADADVQPAPAAA